MSVREIQNLDFDNLPFPRKVYTKLESIKLPTDFPHPTSNTIDCVTEYETSGGTVDLSTITELLYFSAWITKTIKYLSGETYDFRAAACTGARYEIEVYLACGQVPGLAAGIYHFNPKDFSLRRLREGDYRSFLCTAAGENEEILSGPVTFILTAMHWRSAWKYQVRAFRHFYLSTILRASTRSVPPDFLRLADSTLIDTYLIVNAVDEIPSGTYYYNREEGSLELQRRNDFRDTAGYLCLNQPLGADGSAVAFLITNLEAVLKAHGNRGYSAAQLESGIILGKMNLVAFALEIGATGITFYDDAITEFFSPHASGKSNILSVVLGVPAYGKRPSFQTGAESIKV